MKTRISRRSLLQFGMGATVLASGSADARTASGTPAQTTGPFFPREDQADKDADLTIIEGRAQPAQGEVVVVSGSIFDDVLEPVAGALIDVWQANAHGRYAHPADSNPAPLDPNFQGWAQMRSDEQGTYRFKTIIPGPYLVSEEWSRPPHIHFKVSKRGFHELATQMYFAGNPLNEVDRLLLAHPESERAKLIVRFTGTGPDRAEQSGEFNIVLRRVRES